MATKRKRRKPAKTQTPRDHLAALVESCRATVGQLSARRELTPGELKALTAARAQLSRAIKLLGEETDAEPKESDGGFLPWLQACRVAALAGRESPPCYPGARSPERDLEYAARSAARAQSRARHRS